MVLVFIGVCATTPHSSGYPTQNAALDAAFEMGTSKLPDGAAKFAGIAAGEKAAAAILADRKADGFNAPSTYRPATSPGVYITTALPVMSHVAGIKPFALKSVSQFRPGPPPKLDSALWARDFNETKPRAVWSPVNRCLLLTVHASL